MSPRYSKGNASSLLPRQVTSPDVAVASPASTRSNVDLPEPLAPTTKPRFPGPNVRSSPSNKPRSPLPTASSRAHSSMGLVTGRPSQIRPRGLCPTGPDLQVTESVFFLKEQ